MSGSARGTKRKTIGVLVPSFEDVGGVPTVAAFVLRTIARRSDFDVRVISLATSSRDPCSLLLSDPRTWLRGCATRRGRCHGWDFTHVGARFGEFEFQRLGRRPALDRLLEGCDLIQVVAGAPSWACTALDLGKPVVLQVATLTAVERRMRAREAGGLKALWRAAMTRITARLDEHALRRVDAVLVENPWMQAHAEAASKGVKTRVAYGPPGVDAELFRPARPGDAPPTEPYILAVGRFADVRKNPMLLLEAYARVAAGLKDAPALIMAGTAGPGPEFWARAAELGIRERIRFETGPTIETLAGLFRNATALAVPSDEEGFGIVVIEAMAAGVPVVSTRCGGPDGIITDGVDGWLVDRDDAAAMAERLQAVIADPDAACEMGRRARATVEARYALDVAGDVYLRVYDELLAG